MKQVKLGIIGLTGRGRIAEHWHDPKGRSVVIAGMDTDSTALKMFKEKVNQEARVTQSIDEILSMEDIDAVAIASPDFTHEEYVIKAFEAGKHVFSEKPMAITTDACDRMLSAWKASGKKFMIGFNMRYMNIFRVMKDAIDSGIIGTPQAVWVRHFVGFGGGWYYHDWHASKRNSTGLLLQKASHDIDMIHWLTGKYTKKVVGMGKLAYYGGDKDNSLICDKCDEKNDCVEYSYCESDMKSNKMNMCAFRKEVDVEDVNSIMMELDGGIQANYMQCHFTANYCRNYTIIGTEGSIENIDDDSKVIVRLRDQSKRWKNLANYSYDVKPAKGGHGGADPLICKDFIDMLLDDKEPIATPLAGRMSVAVACAGTESLRNNSKLIEIPQLPKDLEKFVF